ncbi:SDR family oxidoreductase [Paraburkholderia rhynchosiae]|uniref:NmrA-like domain-containing protein n=1 Tax=Paraburkholderia rhynchosiae TaxID=487049 RepID=A0A2N7W531_9BURK|nr:NmrA family NAD(P)-binding protein [Paraburkholderia rhynchosiae]PMS24508.1 hypothetical protein C0Z16_30805 [Paraburkholderia rhynchosiae]CAB3735889.1 hypothetical protein LMG27174_06248 [Paraburkholderia rhynchosiae]
MSEKRVVGVMCASGRMGQAQVRQLLATGHSPRAFSRSWKAVAEEFRSVKAVAADFGDVESMASAFEGLDAIFSTIPSFAGANSFQYARNLIDAAKRADVTRIVHNSAMWAPDTPCGEPLYDLVLELENIFAASGLDVTIFRPVLFMDNLLTRFQKPDLVGRGLYRYCQRPGLMANWISMDDLAKFMVAALDRDDLIGRRVVVGGPQTLAIEEVVSILSEILGRSITYEYESPYDLGVRMHGVLGLGDQFPREAYAEMMRSFYTFNNESAHQPFVVDMATVLKEIPIHMSTLREWASRQDWSLEAKGPVAVGSLAG